MKIYPRSFADTAFLFLSLLPSAFAQSGGTQAWTTHTDPAGFSVNVPAGWSVAHDTEIGSVTISRPHGERVTIWPVSVGQQLESRQAAVLLRQLVSKVDSQVSWGLPKPSSTAVRAFGRSAQRSATAVLSWANGTSGATAYLSYVGAPTDSYRGTTDTFVRILESFHIVQDPSFLNAPAQGASGGNLSFVSWNDPHEGAFTVSVPLGWKVIGGAYRLSATDVRYAITMASPDGQVRAIVGDSNIGMFTQPTQMLARGGLREGQYQVLGDGTKLAIRRYISGQQFALSYVQNVVGRQCEGLRVDSNSVREDLASTFSQAARNEGRKPRTNHRR